MARSLIKKRIVVAFLSIAVPISATTQVYGSEPPSPPNNMMWTQAALDQLGMDASGRSTEIDLTINSYPAAYAGYTATGGETGPTKGTIHLIENGPGLDPSMSRLIEMARTSGMEIAVDYKSRSLLELMDIQSLAEGLVIKAMPEDSEVGSGVNDATNQVDIFLGGPYVTEATSNQITSELFKNFGDAVALKPGLGEVDDWGSRTNDWLRFKGGSKIRFSTFPNSSCTSGFALTNLYGNEYMVGAGHCAGIDTGQIVRHGSAPWDQLTTYFGTVEFNRNHPGLPTVGSGLTFRDKPMDAVLIKKHDDNHAYAGYVFIGGAVTNTAYRVSSAFVPCGGCVVYASGAVTGDKPATITYTDSQQDMCVYSSTTGVYGCSVTLIYGSQGPVGTDGDSGAPVYRVDPNNGYARQMLGVLKGGSVGASGSAYVTRADHILSFWSSTVTTS